MKIYPYYFFMAFFFGIFISYLTVPIKDIIIKNPTPENVAKVVDQNNCNKNNTCYRYKIKPSLV